MRRVPAAVHWHRVGRGVVESRTNPVDTPGSFKMGAFVGGISLGQMIGSNEVGTRA